MAIKQFLKRCAGFLSREVVLCAAVVLAVVSAFWVPPSTAYFSYIDWNTLALLFSLMAVMKGVQKAGLFGYLGSRLLLQANTSRKMLLVLVFLPFVCSMVITNDVSLITFVPFGIIVLRMAQKEQLLIPVVVMQTVAANLGSMLTPMGNPQNLYLYARSGMSFWALCGLMLPYVLLSGIGLGVLILLQKSAPVAKIAAPERLAGAAKPLVFCALGFGLCLLGLFKVVPPLAVAAVIAVFLLFADRSLLAQVDYSLLGTFFAFFIFTGNMGSLESVKAFLSSILAGHVELVSVLVSQVISNVPAALLLSGFTEQWPELIVGCNLGGLGTLIASMASLISYKMVAKEYPAKRGRYFLWFTLCNIGFLALLLLAGVLL